MHLSRCTVAGTLTLVVLFYTVTVASQQLTPFAIRIGCAVLAGLGGVHRTWAAAADGRDLTLGLPSSHVATSQGTGPAGPGVGDITSPPPPISPPHQRQASTCLWSGSGCFSGGLGCSRCSAASAASGAATPTTRPPHSPSHRSSSSRCRRTAARCSYASTSSCSVRGVLRDSRFPAGPAGSIARARRPAGPHGDLVQGAARGGEFVEVWSGPPPSRPACGLLGHLRPGAARLRTNPRRLRASPAYSSSAAACGTSWRRGPRMPACPPGCGAASPPQHSASPSPPFWPGACRRGTGTSGWITSPRPSGPRSASLRARPARPHVRAELPSLPWKYRGSDQYRSLSLATILTQQHPPSPAQALGRFSRTYPPRVSRLAL